MFLLNNVRPVHRAANLATICEPNMNSYSLANRNSADVHTNKSVDTKSA
jgi:hypothetical protein